MCLVSLQISLPVPFINTCPNMWKPFHMVHHSALGALWKWAFQVHALQIPEVSGNLPFAFGLKMERFGAAQHCWAIHYRTKTCLGLGRQAANGPSFCPGNIKIDMWDMQHLWNTCFRFPPGKGEHVGWSLSEDGYNDWGCLVHIFVIFFPAASSNTATWSLLIS